MLRLLRALPVAILPVFAAVPTAGGQTPAVQVVELEIVGGKVRGPDVAVAGGVPVVRVRQGGIVELRWTADKALALHLHGYDIETRVPERGTASMRVHARGAGRFPVERHDGGGHATLLYLEVHPR